MNRGIILVHAVGTSRAWSQFILFREMCLVKEFSVLIFVFRFIFFNFLIKIRIIITSF
jgi:hypothetical protein